jgi:hypothetical protein
MAKDKTPPPAPVVFQYDTPTVTVGAYTFDAASLNAYIRRAWSAFNREEVRYKLAGNAYGDPSRQIDGDLPLDCSGYAWWSTFRKRGGYIWDENPNAGNFGKNWVEIDRPIPGAVVRFSGAPGKHGHVGFVVATSKDNYETLDSSSDKSPPRKGSIRWHRNGVGFWDKRPYRKFVVSKQALVAINGVPHTPSTNVWLAAAKHPIATFSLLGVVAVGLLSAAGYLVYKRRKGVA